MVPTVLLFVDENTYLIFHLADFLRICRIVEKLQLPFPLPAIKVVVARAQLLQHGCVHWLTRGRF